MKAVLSVSGGMDSTGVLLHLLHKGYEVRCFSFDYGQKHRVELERLDKNIEHLTGRGFKVSLQRVNLRDVFSGSTSSLVNEGVETPEGHYADENMKSTVVENRNGIFSSIIYGKALAWANSTRENVVISLGIHSGDHQIYPDCRPESRQAFEDAFKISNWGSERVEYYTPYLNSDKEGILRDSLQITEDLGLDFDLIFANTNTCYKPLETGESCGKCGSCTERLEAFSAIERKDPVTYVE